MSIRPLTSGESELIEANLSVVSELVERMAPTLPSNVNLDDLYSSGVDGLIGAARAFDPEKAVGISGNAFLPYARLRTRGALLDHLRHLDRLPRRERQRYKAVVAATSELEQLHRRPVPLEEACAHLAHSNKEFNRFMAAGSVQADLELDRPDDGGRKREYLIEGVDAQTNQPQEGMEREEMLEILSSQVAKLPEQQRQVLALYYFERKSQVQIAEVMGLSGERISQLHKAAILKLRCYFAKDPIKWTTNKA